MSDGMPDASNWTLPASELTSSEVAGEALAVDVHVPAAELGRDLPEVVLERRLALVEDEADPDRRGAPRWRA